MKETAGRVRPAARAGLGERAAFFLLYLILSLFLTIFLTGCAGKGAGGAGAGKVGEVTPQGSGVSAGSADADSDSDSGTPVPETDAHNRESTNTDPVIDGTDPDNHGAGSNTGKGNTRGTASNSAAAPRIFHVGDIVEDRDLRIVYMASGKYEEKSEYLQPPAGQKYIFLEFSFENRGKDRERSLSLFSFQCYADGFAAQSYYGSRNDLAPSLPPGRRTKGCLYFTVPAEAEEIDVEYKPDTYTGEKIRFLYEGEKDSGYVPEPDPSRTAGAFAVGDSAETDLQRITCVSCEMDDSDNEFIRPADGCSFYTLLFEIENLEGAGGDDQETGVYHFHCYADGADCSSTLFRDDYLTAVISPGRRARGTVTFEVPDDAQTVEVEYRPDYGRVRSLVFTLR